MEIEEALKDGRPVAVFPTPQRDGIRFWIERNKRVEEHTLKLENGRFKSLSPRFPSLDWFEREVYELYGLKPEGHPSLNPLRRHDRPYCFPLYQGLHEVPVGPVHAGIIEPGHFRFSVLGESIVHLEIRLGYQHRGLLGLLRGKPLSVALLLAERAGSEPVAHALAFARAVEKAGRLEVAEETERLRLALLEMERAFGHLGRLAGLFTDIGYAHAATEVGRIRALLQGEVDRLTGHRYGRGFIRVGGTADPRTPPREVGQILSRYRLELGRVLPRFLKNPSVLERMRYVGKVSEEEAQRYGFVGPTARASGISRDLRGDEPLYPGFTPVVRTGGDVLARAQVYMEESLEALKWAEEFLKTGLPGAVPPLEVKEGEAWSRLEGGRGETFYLVRLEDGALREAHLVDPSFKNWRALSLAVRGMGLPDFPLCNKSFDLSYAGCDL